MLVKILEMSELYINFTTWIIAAFENLVFEKMDVNSYGVLRNKHVGG